MRQVVDDFLSTPALETLVHYCRASTVWTDFLYKGGYVGTSLTTGLGGALTLWPFRWLWSYLDAALSLDLIGEFSPGIRFV